MHPFVLSSCTFRAFNSLCFPSLCDDARPSISCRVSDNCHGEAHSLPVGVSAASYVVLAVSSSYWCTRKEGRDRSLLNLSWIAWSAVCTYHGQEKEIKWVRDGHQAKWNVVDHHNKQQQYQQQSIFGGSERIQGQQKAK